MGRDALTGSDVVTCTPGPTVRRRGARGSQQQEPMKRFREKGYMYMSTMGSWTLYSVEYRN